jgi:hypothetical protein
MEFIIPPLEGDCMQMGAFQPERLLRMNSSRPASMLSSESGKESHVKAEDHLIDRAISLNVYQVKGRQKKDTSDWFFEAEQILECNIVVPLKPGKYFSHCSIFSTLINIFPNLENCESTIDFVCSSQQSSRIQPPPRAFTQPSYFHAVTVSSISELRPHIDSSRGKLHPAPSPRPKLRRVRSYWGWWLATIFLLSLNPARVLG